MAGNEAGVRGEECCGDSDIGKGDGDSVGERRKKA